MAVSIATINVNGIGELHKRSKVFTSLKNSNFDLYLLQETHLPDLKQGEHWQKQWGCPALWSPGTNRSSGVGLLIKPGSSIEIVNHRSDSDGRVLCSKLRIGGHVFKIINVYAANDHSVRADVFGNLWRYAFRNLDTVMAGEFNCIPDTGTTRNSGLNWVKNLQNIFINLKAHGSHATLFSPCGMPMIN